MRWALVMVGLVLLGYLGNRFLHRGTERIREHDGRAAQRVEDARARQDSASHVRDIGSSGVGGL